MKKLFMTVIVLAILSTISTAAYIYIATKSFVDELIESTPPFLNIDYQRFSNPMDGSVAIHGVRVAYGNDFAMDISSVEFKLDSALDYIDLDKLAESGEIPEKLQLKINHAYIDNDYFKDIDKFVAASESDDNFDLYSYISTLGCNDVDLINLSLIEKLGYNGLDQSIDMDFSYNKNSDQAKLTFSYVIEEMESFVFNTTLPNINHIRDLANIENDINHFELTYQDLGFNRKLSSFCSKQTQTNEAQYIKKHAEALETYLTSASVKLHDDLYQAYQLSLADQAKITFKFQPTNSISLKYLDLFEPKDWPKVLGLSIFVNGNKVGNPSFDWPRNNIMTNLAKASEIAKASHNRSAEKYYRYVKMPVSKLSKYRNHQIEFKSNRGKKYKGTILGMSGGRLIVDVQMQGGHAEMPIRLSEIASASVYVAQ